jgi:hypothetical protein
MSNQLIHITLQVDTLRIQRGVDDFILDSIYDVDCRRSEPSVGEYCQLSDLAHDHGYIMGLFVSFIVCVYC